MMHKPLDSVKPIRYIVSIETVILAGADEEGEMAFLSDCAKSMNAYRQLTGDKTYASEVQSGNMRLVRVTYDSQGESTIEPRSEWVPVGEWLNFMRSKLRDALAAARGEKP